MAGAQLPYQGSGYPTLNVQSPQFTVNGIPKAPPKLNTFTDPYSGSTGVDGNQFTTQAQKFGLEQQKAETARTQQQQSFANQQKAFDAQMQGFQSSQQRQADAYGRSVGALNGLQGAMGSGMGGGYFGGTAVPLPQAQLGPNPAGPSTMAADSAAFGAAKARAGSMGRSAVDSLSSEMANRGIVGSGVEGRGLVDRLAAATNPLSDVNVGQLHENVGINQHNQDLGAQQAQTQFQGSIAQRGQDIQQQEQNAQLAQQRQAMQLQMIQQALSGLNRMY